jgi:hypothetical protein
MQALAMPAAEYSFKSPATSPACGALNDLYWNQEGQTTFGSRENVPLSIAPAAEYSAETCFALNVTWTMKPPGFCGGYAEKLQQEASRILKRFIPHSTPDVAPDSPFTSVMVLISGDGCYVSKMKRKSMLAKGFNWPDKEWEQDHYWSTVLTGEPHFTKLVGIHR